MVTVVVAVAVAMVAAVAVMAVAVVTVAAAAAKRASAPISTLRRVRIRRMRDVEEEEQRRPRELHTRAKQNMSNRDEPRARDEGLRAGQRAVRWLGAGCRSAHGPAGYDGRICAGLGASA